MDTDSKQKALTLELTEDTWIGLYKDPNDWSNWLWVDGSKLNFTNWKYGEPNDVTGVYGDCGLMYPKGSEVAGKWYSERCTISSHYICEITGKPRKNF